MQQAAGDLAPRSVVLRRACLLLQPLTISQWISSCSTGPMLMDLETMERVQVLLALCLKEMQEPLSVI